MNVVLTATQRHSNNGFGECMTLTKQTLCRLMIESSMFDKCLSLSVHIEKNKQNCFNKIYACMCDEMGKINKYWSGDW